MGHIRFLSVVFGVLPLIAFAAAAAAASEEQDVFIKVTWIIPDGTSHVSELEDIHKVIEPLVQDLNESMTIQLTVDQSRVRAFTSVHDSVNGVTIRRGLVPGKLMDVFKSGAAASRASSVGTSHRRQGRRLLDDESVHLVAETQQHIQHSALEKRILAKLVTAKEDESDSVATRRTLQGFKGFVGGTNNSNNRIRPRERVEVREVSLSILLEQDIPMKAAVLKQQQQQKKPRGRAGARTHDIHGAAAAWNIDRSNQRKLPLDGKYALPAEFEQLGDHDRAHVYIVDTGIRTTHQEFAGRVTAIHDGFPGQPAACHTHGTHVASTVGGNTVGINRHAKLFDVRVLDCDGTGSMSTVLAGVITIVDHCKAQTDKKRTPIINLSLGGSVDPTAGVGLALAEEFALARSQCDAIVVAAAGNSASDACDFYPAGYVNVNQGRVLAIGATAITDTFATQFSNRGSCVALNAPGVNVRGATNANDGSYADFSGTSMASPYVAGLASAHAMRKQDSDDVGFNDVVIERMLGDYAVTSLKQVPAGTTAKLAVLVPSGNGGGGEDSDNDPGSSGPRQTTVSWLLEGTCLLISALFYIHRFYGTHV